MSGTNRQDLTFRARVSTARRPFAPDTNAYRGGMFYRIWIAPV